jgi:hypothetical protein
MLFLQLTCPISCAEADDIQCLHSTRKQLNDPQGNLYTWNFDNTTKGFACDFLGITCWHNHDNKVLEVSLPQMGLQGEFPTGLKSCRRITSLDLSQNSFRGEIPKELCNWFPYLVTLDLSQNQFTGHIPAELQNCTFLNVLRLDGNQFFGEIPWQLMLLERLNEFNVTDNKLSGNIPPFFLNHNWIASNFQKNPGLVGLPIERSLLPSSNRRPDPMIVAAFFLYSIVLLLWISVGLRWMISKERSRRSKELNDWQKYVQARSSVKVRLFEKPIRKMRLADLVAATDHFSEDNIILCGRTGILYKAKLRDGSLLAVKRLRPCSQSAKDFKCEMKALAHLRHRNLVPLLGYCIAGEERLLVYKYMARGTLLSCLHAGEHDTLDWATRFRICMGTARGLAWLHHDCDPHVVHRNISSGIIFLDEEYEPRISGFGLARLMNGEDTCVPISSSGEKADELVEVFGYDAPEAWRNSSAATLKGDVYSFGILVLEIITGLRPRDTIMDKGNSSKEMTFLEWIHGRFAQEGGCVEQAIDRYHVNDQTIALSDEESSVVAELMRAAFRCVNNNPDERPSMHEVYTWLRKIGERYSAISDDDEEISFQYDIKQNTNKKYF